MSGLVRLALASIRSVGGMQAVRPASAMPRARLPAGTFGRLAPQPNAKALRRMTASKAKKRADKIKSQARSIVAGQAYVAGAGGAAVYATPRILDARDKAVDAGLIGPGLATAISLGVGGGSVFLGANVGSRMAARAFDVVAKRSMSARPGLARKIRDNHVAAKKAAQTKLSRGQKPFR